MGRRTPALVAVLALLTGGCAPGDADHARAIRSPDQATRLGAMLAAGTKPQGPATRDALLDVVGDADRNPAEIARAAWALGRQGVGPGAAALRGLLDHPEALVRAVACMALAHASDQPGSDRGTLAALQHDDDLVVRSAARSAIQLLAER